MSNAYDSPNSNVGCAVTPRPVSVLKRIVTSVCSIFSALLYFTLYTVIPQFAETFTSFNVTLPPLTFWVIEAYALFFLLGVASLLLNCIWIAFKLHHHYSHTLYRCSMINAVMAFCVLLLTMAALYLPMFDTPIAV